MPDLECQAVLMSMGITYLALLHLSTYFPSSAAQSIHTTEALPFITTLKGIAKTDRRPLLLRYDGHALRRSYCSTPVSSNTCLGATANNDNDVLRLKVEVYFSMEDIRSPDIAQAIGLTV